MENSEENIHIKDNISQNEEEKQNERNEKEKSRKGEKRKREEITEKGGKRTERRRNVSPATLSSTDKNQDKPITKRDFEQFGEILVELQEQMFTRLLNAQKTKHTERREDDTRETQLNTGSDESPPYRVQKQ